MDERRRVAEIIESLDLAIQAIEGGSATHHLINAQITRLGLLRIDPAGWIKAAVELLERLVAMPDERLLKQGKCFLTVATSNLKTWISEFDMGDYQGKKSAEHFPTEVEQIVNAGDVSRRIRSGMAEAYGQFGEGVDVD